MVLTNFPISSAVFSLVPASNPTQNQQSLLVSNHQCLPTGLRLSKWNAIAGKFVESRSGASSPFEEIEDGIGHVTADEIPPPSTDKPSSSRFIQRGKFKHSKQAEIDDHPAFRRVAKFTRLPRRVKQEDNGKVNIRIGEDGASYIIDGAPFEFKYSYTETPKVKAIKLREPPFSPFGPAETPRPWTGRAPLPPSKKQLKEFDSFQLPPNKKGVKPVQSPGPHLEGTGPRYVNTREEILGEPLTADEVDDLIKGCLKSRRQLNMGRDGLTHNMLDNIHAHWKRRRVCKIKCKGVCTVDLDNVCQQLEEKTGGKIIYRKGGVLFLFRGRNYNFKTRPRFPLMLWKPVSPVYPRLVKKVPEGLTPERAAEMRARGLKLTPICKLAKNGLYTSLVKLCREAFEVCELVKIDCQGLNPSDYRKIGAKLKDLVPCVIISFEREQILLWSESKRENVIVPATKSSSTSSNIVEHAEPPSSAAAPDSVSASIESESINNLLAKEPMPDRNKAKDEEPCLFEVVRLWKQALENGNAVRMKDEDMNADGVYECAVALARTAPPCPVFRHEGKRERVPASKIEGGHQEDKGKRSAANEREEKKGTIDIRNGSAKGSDQSTGLLLPQRPLVIDELAKLLAG